MFGPFAHLLYLLYSLSNLGPYLAADFVTHNVVSYPKIGGKMPEHYEEMIGSDDNKLVVQLDLKLSQNLPNPDLSIMIVPALEKCFILSIVESNVVAERLVSALIQIERTPT